MDKALRKLWNEIDEKRKFVLSEIHEEPHGHGLQQIKAEAHTMLANEYADIMDKINDILELASEPITDETIINIPPKDTLYLKEISYHKENEEGGHKTFRNLRSNKWYYEKELVQILGIKCVDQLKKGKELKEEKPKACYCTPIHKCSNCQHS